MSPMPFSDFSEDIQLNILSFLRPVDISAFACTCRRYSTLCSFTSPSADLWPAICDRRWGCKTQIRCWSASPSPLLYKTLEKWEEFIGFWFHCSEVPAETPLLFLFEWGPSCIICYRVEPSTLASPYAVSKIPFLWLGLSPTCETIGYLHLGCRFGSLADLDDFHPNSDVIKVLLFSQTNYIVLEESPGLRSYIIKRFVDNSKEMLDLEASVLDGVVDDLGEVFGLEASPPDHVMLEIHKYFYSRKSSRGEQFSTRKSKKKWSTGRRKVFLEYLHKFCYTRPPTPMRPLQGLWKGISKNMKLEFYFVTYVIVQEISCHLVRDMPKHYYCSPIFTTSTTPFLPFSKVEQETYNKLKNIGSTVSPHFDTEMRIVSRILVLPTMTDSSDGHINVEGKIWEYEDGTFGFLQNNFIVDLKPVDFNGCLLDVV